MVHRTNIGEVMYLMFGGAHAVVHVCFQWHTIARWNETGWHRNPMRATTRTTNNLYAHIEDGFEIGLRSKVMTVSSAIKMQRLRSPRRCVACVDSFEKLIRLAGVSVPLSVAPILCEQTNTMTIRSHTFDTSYGEHIRIFRSSLFAQTYF